MRSPSTTTRWAPTTPKPSARRGSAPWSSSASISGRSVPVIALLGATGYTGKLTAAELSRRGIPHRLGGRSPEKLAALPSDAERFVVDVGESGRLDAFLEGASAVITTVGPFNRLGMPAVEAAA